jgi:hypothetical protein
MTINTVVHTFTAKLGRPENIAKAVSLYLESARSARRFHKVVLYTDEESLSLFSDAYEDVRVINTDGMFMLDDMKLSVLPLIAPNEVMVDGDVYLRSPLVIRTECDAVCDVGAPTEKSLPCIETLNLMTRMGISDIIPFYKPGLQTVPNIGVLRFSCDTVRDGYLRWFRVLRDWIKVNGLADADERSRRRLTVKTTPQYLLGAYMQSVGKEICYARVHNDYSHYMLDVKYRDGFKICQ